MTDLLERADALAVLSAAVASAGARPGTTAGGPAGAPSGAAAAGTAPGGRVVLVRGEAGVGKSVLVEEFCRHTEELLNAVVLSRRGSHEPQFPGHGTNANRIA